MRRDWLAVNGQETTDVNAPALLDFGFHYPLEFVRRAYLYLERGWGWPESGGWGDQDGRLLDDLDTYYQIYAQVGKATEIGWRGNQDYEEQYTTVERRRFNDVLG